MHNGTPIQHQAANQDGLTLSQVALGCELLGGADWGAIDTEAAMAAARTAYQRGITVFDTADVYGLGRSEEVLAEVLGELRTEVTICSKFGVNWRPTSPGARAETFRDCRPERVREALEGSLRRLRLECVPLYLIHWPDPAVPIRDTMAALRACQKQGKVMCVGVSNCSPSQIREAHAALPLSVVQLPLSLVSAADSAEAIQCCRGLGIPVMSYGPLAQGFLSGKYGADCRFGSDDRRHRLPHFGAKFLAARQPALQCLRRVATRYGKTPAQVALRWALDYPGVSTIVVGAKTPSQLDENLGAVGWALSLHDWNSLMAAWNVRTAA